MTIRESVEKEMNIYTMYCENTVDTALALSEIDMYTEGAVDSIKEYGQKIIQAIKEFIEKAKLAFKKKIEEFKAKRDMKKLEAMWKKNINNVATVTDFVEEKEIKKEAAKAISKLSKISQKAIGTTDTAKLESFMEEVDAVERDMTAAIEKKSKTMKIKLSGNPEKMLQVEEFYDTLSKMSVTAISDLAKQADKSMKKLANGGAGDDLDDKFDVEKKKLSLIQKAEAGVSKITTRVGNVFSRNRSMLLSAIRESAQSAAKHGVMGVFAGSMLDMSYPDEDNHYAAKIGAASAGVGAIKGAIRGAADSHRTDKLRNQYEDKRRNQG